MDRLEAADRSLIDRYVALRTPDDAAVAKALALTLHRVEHGPAVVLPEAPASRPNVVWARVAMFAIAAAAVVLIAWRGIAALERVQYESAPAQSAPLVVEPTGTEGDVQVRVPETVRELVVEPAPSIIDAAPVEPPPIERATPPQRARPMPTLADELALLRDADAALARGDAKKALALLDAHAKQFPRGQMVPERMLQRAVALCRLGKREKSRAAIDKLLATYPTTPLRARASTVCSDESP